MPTLAGPPLLKVTLNLYEADVIAMEAHYGRGWTTIVRELVAAHIPHVRRPHRTLEDIAREIGDPDNG
jgi:hypothetical protein